MSREHDLTRVRGQTETVGPGLERARGHAWGGSHCRKRLVKNGVIRRSMIILVVVFSHPSSRSEGSVIQSIRYIVLFCSSVLERAHLPFVFCRCFALLE